jgi:hypothetical protein
VERLKVHGVVLEAFAGAIPIGCLVHYATIACAIDGGLRELNGAAQLILAALQLAVVEVLRRAGLVAPAGNVTLHVA